MQPLKGLTVVTLEHAIAAPFATRQLADLGARVIKIERPGVGDFARGYDQRVRGLASHFVWTNRSKESLTLDVKQPRAAELLLRLITAKADVVVQNLAPGAAARLGISHDALKTGRPDLIVCDISGYGDDAQSPGPYRDKKAYDLLIQSESGFVSVTGTPDEPSKAGISIADIAAGMYAYSSILAALLQRQRDGLGRRIDISMLECLVEWMTPQLYVQLGTGAPPPRAGLRHNMIVPYGAYRCADGNVMFAIQNDREWRRLCDVVLGRSELADDPRYLTNTNRLANRRELEYLIETIFGSLSVGAVIERLERGGIANAVVNDLAAVAAHPQLAARGRWTDLDSFVGPIPALLPPHNLAGVRPAMARVPALGEHTAAVLAELEAGTSR